MTLCRATVLTLACVWCAAAQPQTKLQFDVASVKPGTPPEGRLPFAIPRMLGGPGTKEPGHISLHNYALIDLILYAYSIQAPQLSGPEWILAPSRSADSTFDIEAKYPPDATRSDVRHMLQSLLEDRFELKLHRETKPGAVYWLVVVKPNPKLKESPPLPPSSEPEEPEKLGPRGADGFPVMPPSHSGLFVHVDTSVIHLKFLRRSMPQFAEWLWGQVKKPVIDHTGLAGIYDFYLDHGREPVTPRAAPNGGAEASEPGGPDLFGAIQPQLGLKMTPQTGDVEMLVIDHANRSPAGN